MSSCIAGRDEERGGGRAAPQLAASFSLITMLGMTGEEVVARGAGRVSVNAWRRVECVLNPTKRAHAQYLPPLCPHSYCGYPAGEDRLLALV